MDLQHKNVVEFFNRMKKRINSLGHRQKIMLGLLVFAIFFNVYFTRLIKPQFTALRRLKAEATKLNSQAEKLKVQIPDLTKEKLAVDEGMRENKLLKDKLSALEKQLPSFSRVPALLGALVKETQDYEIDLLSIKPKGTKTNQQYSRLDIEMQFNTTYYSLTNYLNRLENLSRFLNTTDIILEEPKEEFFQGGITATMVLSTILSPASSTPETLAQEPVQAQQVKDIDIERNPFTPQDNITGYARKSKYVLSGITYAGEHSTAIINNKVYRVGDYLDKKRLIREILNNMVIIDTGHSTEVLMLQK